MSGFLGSISTSSGTSREGHMDAAFHSISACYPGIPGTWKGPEADLRQSADLESRPLPFTWDGVHYLIGEVRLDRKLGLLADVQTQYPTLKEDIPDLHLLGYAFALWGESCLKKIAGDFSFALWNNKNKTLFAARDHFGILPFYYHLDGEDLYFSNFYSCFKAIPQAIAKLEPALITNYLITGLDASFTNTLYAGIQKLPPAHAFHFKEGKVEVQRYWAPDRKVTRPLKTTEEYVQDFTVLFENAVRDRMQTPCIATHLSGGMDSSSVAAMANKVLRTTYPNNHKFNAYTVCFSHLLSEREGGLAQAVSQHLGISQNFIFADNYLKSLYSDAPITYMEPRGNPEASPELALLREVHAQKTPVLLTGFGSDTLFVPRYEGVRDTLQFYSKHRRLPPLGLKNKVKNLFQAKKQIPGWIKDSKTAARAFRQGQRRGSTEMIHNPLWISIFEHGHPGFNGIPMQIRHPFFSLDLVNFLLTVPNYLLFDKYLLRLAMRPYLPESIVTRPKTILHGLAAVYTHAEESFLQQLKIDVRENAEFLEEIIALPHLLNELESIPTNKLPHHKSLLHLRNLLSWKKTN